MSLILSGTVLQVTGGKPGKNFETGEITEAIPIVFIQHNTSSSPDSDINIEKIKCKEAAQVSAFRNAVGKQILVAVRLWAQGGKQGFWLEQGVLPTVVSSSSSQPLPLKAAA